MSLSVFSLMLVISKLNQHRSHKILTEKSSRYSSAKSLYLIPDPRFPDPLAFTRGIVKQTMLLQGDLRMLDFSPINEQKQSVSEFAATVSKDDLYRATNELAEHFQTLLEGAEDADVGFVPNDPTADDAGASPEERYIAWTFGHILVHVTAGMEEGAMLALSLARGVDAKERSRYETDWKTMQTVAQARQRIQESRRMCLSMLDAWPDEPHMEITQTPVPRFGPLNPIGRYVLGLWHGVGHVEQITEAMRQAKAARG